MNTRTLDRLSWREMADYMDRMGDRSAILIPVGAVEPHGYHAPLGTDHFIAVELANRVAERADALVYPALPLGTLNVWYDFRAFRGSVHISPDVLKSVCVEIGSELARNGFRSIVFTNGHGPNTFPLTEAAFAVYEKSEVRVGVLEWWRASHDEMVRIKGFAFGNHADLLETSILLTSAERELVDLGVAEVNPPELDDVDAEEIALYKQGFIFTREMDERWIGTSGNMGDPTGASRESGESLIGPAVEAGVRMIEVLRRYATAASSPDAT